VRPIAPLLAGLVLRLDLGAPFLFASTTGATAVVYVINLDRRRDLSAS